MDETVERPISASEKYSAGQNFSATFASGAENKIRMMMPTKPPQTEATSDTPRPYPGRPFFARG